MFLANPGEIIQALDAATGELIWTYRRENTDLNAQQGSPAGRGHRNIAIYDRFIVNTSDDDYFFGLDATTGDLVWETQIFDYQVTPAGHSSGPIIADGKAISGRSCRPLGGPESCVIVAHNDHDAIDATGLPGRQYLFDDRSLVPRQKQFGASHAPTVPSRW